MIEGLLQLDFFHLHFALQFIAKKIEFSLWGEFKNVKEQTFERIWVKRLERAL